MIYTNSPIESNSNKLSAEKPAIIDTDQSLAASSFSYNRAEIAQLLEKQVDGIKYSSIVDHLSQNPVCIIGTEYRDNPDLTIILLALSDQLQEEYNARALSETMLQRVFSLIGKKTESQLFLESKKNLNRAVVELVESGVLVSQHEYIRPQIIIDKLTPVSDFGTHLIKIRVSELGQELAHKNQA